MSEKTISWRKLDDLHLWGDNPNQGDIGAILTSINRFGYNESIIVWQDRVQGGNHRVMALHQLWKGGWRPDEKDRAVRVNGDGLEVATWDVSHLESEQEANAFGLALNRTTRLGIDDPAKLSALLQDIKQVNEAAFLASGYDGDDLDAILRDIEGYQDGEWDNSDQWVGLPEYETGDSVSELQMIVHFETEQHRSEFAQQLGLIITEKTNSIWWPPKERRDPAAIRFEED